MQLEALEVQIFVSLALVLGALFVALVCDFLKGNNESLREHNIELRVRQDERNTRDRLVGAIESEREHRLLREIRAQAASPPQAASPAPNGFARAEATPVRPSLWARPEELDQVDRLVKRIKKRVEPPTAPLPAEDERELPVVAEPPIAAEAELRFAVEAESPFAAEVEPPIPVEAEPPILAKTELPIAAEAEPTITAEITVAEDTPAEESFPEAEAAKPDADERPVRPSSKVTPIDAIGGERSVFAESANLAAQLERVASLRAADVGKGGGVSTDGNLELSADEQPEIFEAEVEDVAQSVLEADPIWGRSEDEDEFIFEEAPIRASLPTGMQNADTLADLTEADEPFHGIVVAIGVTRAQDPRRPAIADSDEQTQDVRQLIESLLTEQDAAFEASDEEYILLLPAEGGSKGQRRLQYISECLWDHQIRSVGASSTMFCWGAVEVLRESLSKAVENAEERMYQTKRNRERIPQEIHHYRTSLAN